MELDTIEDGVLLPVQAQPRARKNGIVGLHADRLKVAVTQVPEKGKANDALVKVLAKALSLRKSQIRLHSGATSTQKTFVVTDISAAELGNRITNCLGEESPPT